MRAAAIQVEEIRHQVGRALVLEVDDLSVRQGEVLTLLGRSGAGKSSLLHLMGLLEAPRSGSVLIAGRRAGPRSLWARRRIASAMQNGVLWKGSVAMNVEYGLKVRHVARPEREGRVREALDLVGLSGYQHRSSATLSGGEAQRVALARAMVVRPEVLLLDEPLSNIDEPFRESLAAMLRGFCSEIGAATVWVTHDRAEALAAGDRIAVLDDGKLLQHGPGLEVFTRPASEQVARLVGADNVLAGSIVESKSGLARIDVHGEELFAASSFPTGTRVFVLVRPEDISIYRERPEASSPRNLFRGKIGHTVVLGPLAKIYIDHPVPIVAAVTRPTVVELDLKAGSQIWLSFKATSSHVIRRS